MVLMNQKDIPINFKMNIICLGTRLGTTLKYFFKKGDKIFLEAAKSWQDPIELNSIDVTFQGNY